MFSFYSYGERRDLHSFPTRRSSDLSSEMPRISTPRLVAQPRMASTAAAESRCGCSTRQRDSAAAVERSEEHTSELQSQSNLVCRLLLEKKKYIPPSSNLPSGKPTHI